MSDFPTQDDLDDMENVIQEMANGAVVDLLEAGPAKVDTQVQLGLSVGVDALRDGEREIALAALKTAVERLEENE